MLHTINLQLLRRRGFTTQEVTTRWGTLHTIEGPGAGDGPPVVLVHGVSGRGSVFGPVALALQGFTSRLLVPDLLGHGDSAVPDTGLTLEAIQESLDELLLASAPEDAVLVGVSMGGMLVTRHASRYPDRVRGLVLANPGGARVEQQDFEHSRALLTPRTHREARRLAQAGLASRSALLHHLAAMNLKRRLAVPHIRSFLESISPEMSLSPDEVRSLPVPVRLLVGEEDGLLPTRSHDWYAEHLPPTSEVVRLPGVGHAPMVDAPNLFAEQIADFVRDIAPGKRAVSA